MIETPHSAYAAPSWADPLLRGWARHGGRLLTFAVVFMATAGVFRLATELPRLLWQTQDNAAIDLMQRYEEVQFWFAGGPVYSTLRSAVYPPASYAMFWPLLGWPSLPLARWIWAATCLVALGGLAYVLVRESGDTTRRERLFVALMPVSVYATGITIGNGQLSLHLLLLLVGGLILLRRGQRRWRDDLLLAAAMGAVLIKPTLTVPFFWLVVFVPNRLRPAVLLTAGYGVLTLVATAFQPGDVVSLHQGWIQRGLEGAVWGSRPLTANEPGGAIEPMGRGHSNVHGWLGALGLAEWNMPASLLMLLALGYWTYRHRTVDVWLLFGVVAIVARFWTYHRVYDDLLLLLPMIALFRIVKQDTGRPGRRVVSGFLLALALGTALMPARLLITPPPWSALAASTLTAVWILLLIFLLFVARRERSESKTNNRDDTNGATDVV